MTQTPLHDALLGQADANARPVRIAEYRGATTAANFGDARAEFSALREGCGVYDLGFRAKISLTGDDRVRWLNGMVTNNIRDLATGQGVYAFLLNPQGRILGDLYAYNRGESLLLDTDRSQVEKMLATFEHYIIMDDVEVAEVSEKLTALGVAGPRARAALQTAGIEIPELAPLQSIAPRCNCECECVECTVVRGEEVQHEPSQGQSEGQSSQGQPHENQSYEIWLAPKDVKQTWRALLAAGATAVGSEALEMQRVVAGIPLYGVDIRERDLPQETEQTRALNFTKGCYVGQEIVERIRSRGNVHRKFTGFIAENGAQIAPGMKIAAAEKEVGEITSATSVILAGAERTVALGYIRREVGVPGKEVAIGEAKAVVVQLPVGESALQRQSSFAVHREG
jgi:folate-binding protein YgfZ